MCIFCKIISGEIPSYKIYENEDVYAFLDIADDAVGHTLVVPKNHCSSILDASSDTIRNVMSAVQTISKHYTSNCGFTGVNIINNSGESAEQSVNHLHFHIIPRKDNDGMKVFPLLDKKNCDFEQIASLLAIEK